MNHQFDLPVDLDTCVGLEIIQLNEAKAGYCWMKTLVFLVYVRVFRPMWIEVVEGSGIGESERDLIWPGRGCPKSGLEILSTWSFGPPPKAILLHHMRMRQSIWFNWGCCAVWWRRAGLGLTTILPSCRVWTSPHGVHGDGNAYYAQGRSVQLHRPLQRTRTN